MAGRTLGVVSTLALGAVVFVHFDQKRDKKRMHAGVIRDMERDAIRNAQMASEAANIANKDCELCDLSTKRIRKPTD